MGFDLKTDKYLDAGSKATIVITLVLFIVSLFFTGFTHDLLLETGVFLVSVKLILMAYKSNRTTKKLDRELKEIKEMIRTTCQSDEK